MKARFFLSCILVSCFFLPTAWAGPKTKVPECDCSIKTPKNWYVASYRQGADGLDYLVTASPNASPQGSDIPSVNFLRQKLYPEVEKMTQEEFLSQLSTQFGDAEATKPVPAKLGKGDGAMITVDLKQPSGLTVKQEYRAYKYGKYIYLMILTWVDEEDREKLQEPVDSMRL